MFVRLNTASPVPIYRQIVNQIRWQIASRSLVPGDRLPSVRDLAQRLAANQNTILKVYDQLAGEGLIERRRGDGTYVADSGLRLNRDECVRRVRDSLSDAAVQARLFSVSREEAHLLFDGEIDALDVRRRGAPAQESDAEQAAGGALP